jgi:hypothetical protein
MSTFEFVPVVNVLPSISIMILALAPQFAPSCGQPTKASSILWLALSGRVAPVLKVHSVLDLAWLKRPLEHHQDNANQRMELALVGCPQLGANCGAKAKIIIDIDGSTFTTGTNSKVDMNKTMGYKDKCTWLAYAKLNNPTFVLGEGTRSGGTDALGISTGSS